jgi:hypothetical protein
MNRINKTVAAKNRRTEVFVLAPYIRWNGNFK